MIASYRLTSSKPLATIKELSPRLKGDNISASAVIFKARVAFIELKL